MTLKECLEKGFKKFTRPYYEQYKGYFKKHEDDPSLIYYIDKDNTGGIQVVIFTDDILATDWYEYKQKVKKEGWINIITSMLYPNNVYNYIFKSKEDAENMASHHNFVTIKIEWEEEEV